MALEVTGKVDWASERDDDGFSKSVGESARGNRSGGDSFAQEPGDIVFETFEMQSLRLAGGERRDCAPRLRPERPWRPGF